MFDLSGDVFWFSVFLVFSLAALIQILYYSIFYSRIPAGRIPLKGGRKAPVSVIICARNEESKLRSFLPSVLSQDYPDYEVIVVNDCSDDDSDNVLTAFEKEYPRLRVVTIHKEASLAHSKKMALFVGIKAAKNELLLLTDADCQPCGKRWISYMTSGFDSNTSFILGYGAYQKKKGLLNKYIRYDTLFIAMQYMGMAIAGLPYMGVGRNLAYRKSVFMENKGFGPFIHLQSGDDDLFINSLASGHNTKVMSDKESLTRSVPASSFAGFSKQKSRHLSTSPYYRIRSRLLLALEPLSRVLFYLSGVLLLIFGAAWPVYLAVFLVTISFKMIIYRRVQKSLEEQDLLLISLLFDIVSPFINLYFLVLSRRNRHRAYEWK